MTDRPILFSAPMVRSLLSGAKTQTRRLVKTPAPEGAEDAGVFCSPGRDYDGEWMWLDSRELEWASFIGEPFRCPYGVPGDRLWGRESFRKLENASEHPSEPVWYMADGEPPNGHWTGGKPSIHMPRWASRLTLELTDVRVERLQDISEADAIAEGVFPAAVYGGKVESWLPAEHLRERFYPTAAEAYRALWGHINGADSWAANPWVWALSFPPV